VFVAESVGFKLPAVPVCEALADGVLYKTGKRCQSRSAQLGAKGEKKKTYRGFEATGIVEDAVVLDWVMANCCD
jgi:hypothetical protein